MESEESDHGNSYRIKVKETLDHSFTDWFGDLTLTPQKDGKTLLVGPFTDQSALRGLLDQLWNFNITVLSVERIENENDQDAKPFTQV